MASWLYTQDGGKRKRFTQAQGFPSGRYTEEKQILGALLASWDSRIDTLWRYMHGAACPQDPALLDAIQVILRELLASLHMVFDIHHTCDFTQYLLLALEHIDVHRHHIPTEHLLLDESQDTSSSQITLIKKLTQDWKNPHNTIFMVGDPMQSIYRFRHADVREFMRLLDHGFSHHPLIPLTLSSNFRQNRTIVDFSNQLFSAIFPTKPSLEEGAIPFTPSVAIKTERGLVDAIIWEQEASLDAGRSDLTTLYDMDQTLDREESIGLLVRTRARVRDYVDENLPFAITTVDILDAYEHPALQDALCVLILTLHPTDINAWQHLLCSPWIGLELLTLKHLGMSSHLAEALSNPPTLYSKACDTNLKHFLHIFSQNLTNPWKNPTHQSLYD
jgi:superfamily I DNA/RNA helicase